MIRPPIRGFAPRCLPREGTFSSRRHEASKSARRAGRGGERESHLPTCSSPRLYRDPMTLFVIDPSSTVR